jgi:D-alanyl-D-alanine carboxypeptidase/D-alanyl-D-alanine-endopeptidase (penicillin-binding protein 4)
MRKTIRLCCCAWLLWSAIAYAELPDAVAQALSKAGVPQQSVSVFVQAVDQQQPVISHNIGVGLNPASTMKLVTTYAGLELLGPAYHWRTEVYGDGPLHDGVLEGNLIFKGYGDPYFRAEDLWRLLNRLRQAGVRDIRGDLVLDTSYFAPRYDNPGAFDNEPYRAYNAGPSAMLVNLNSTTFRFQPEVHEGGLRIAITTDPELAQIHITNELEVSTTTCPGWRSRLDYQVEPGAVALAEHEVGVTFSGTYYADCGEHSMELSVLSNESYAYNLFRKLWQQLGGSFNGELRHAETPSTAVKLLEQEGLPLAEVVRYINKYSNNVMARQLLLTIAAEGYGLPATEREGELAINAWLAGKGLEFPELFVDNGAGLSRVARISAEHLGQLLLAAYASPVMPELMSSLPILAVDGTLHRRLQDSMAQGSAHIKTGSLDGVCTIAGYVLDENGRRWVVVFLANDARAAYARTAQDALLEWVFGQSP